MSSGLWGDLSAFLYVSNPFLAIWTGGWFRTTLGCKSSCLLMRDNQTIIFN
uniref:Uncharacterized protein n=1 Tax=Echinococcus granulosus TaxID=6210 RepID=A0A068WQ64_ECHGR|nr:hypothetical protein EgrG_000510800 [Echinococcus granulosus]